MLQFLWRSRGLRAVLALLVCAPLLAIAFVAWRVTRVKDQASAEVLAKSELPFRMVPIGGDVPASVDVIPATPGFREVVGYKGNVVVSAQAGLFVYDRNGALIRSYRSGIELPSAELGAMSVGTIGGSAEPEVFIGTRGEGLLAFNGSEFRQILPSEPTLRIITSVLVLGSGRILFGTEHRGMVMFDGQRLSPFSDRLRFAHITALAGNDGDLWIGTLAGGVFHDRGGQIDSLTPLPDPQVLSIAVSGEAAYVGTPLGVVEFRNGQRVRTLADGFFARALAVRGDALYVGTEDEGIIDVPLSAGARPGPPASRTFDENTPAAPIFHMGSLDGEIYAVEANAIEGHDAARRGWRAVISPADSLMADRHVAALALSSGRLWIGYFDHGLDILDAGLEAAVHHEDETLFCINRIVPDPGRARTAVATANGLVMFDSAAQPRQVMGRKDGFLSDHITDVAFRDGGMVAATPAGLSFVDRSGVHSLYAFQGLVNNHVYAVAARGDEVLAGTLGGLSVLQDDAVRANYTTANSHLKPNWITALAPVGDEWFAGTYGGGVLRLDSVGEWHSFADLKDGFVVNANAILVDGDQVYAGSLDRGLFIFDRTSGRWTNTTVGLPSKNVTALAADGAYLYVGTDNGLVRMAKGTLR